MGKFRRAALVTAVLAAMCTTTSFTVRGTAQAAPSLPAAQHHPLRPGNPMIAATVRSRAAIRDPRNATAITSFNWAGYAASRRTHAFRSISADFLVPYVDCAATPDSYFSQWVGLDGLNTANVEQTGVAAQCNGSVPHYYAWTEMYPRAEVRSFSVSAGNAVAVSVTYQAAHKKFVLKLDDLTAGKHFSHSLACAASSCDRSSAEAITEAPADDSGDVLPMADFRAAGFSSIALTDTAGHSGGLSSHRWITFQVVQTGAASHQTVAQPTSLLNGSAFSDYWIGES